MQPDKELLQQEKVVASNSCFELSAGQAQGKNGQGCLFTHLIQDIFPMSGF